MKAIKKIERRLADRVGGFEKAKSARKETKVVQRWETGGYRMPGSRQNRAR